MFSTDTMSPFSAISRLFISRVAQYTPSLQGRPDEKMRQTYHQLILNTYLL